MRRVVIDTNVIVSSTFSELGNPAKIMYLCFSDKLQMVYSTEIHDEYKKVLSYKRLNISDDIQTDILRAIEESGALIEPAISTIQMPDESDRVFYDAAKTDNATLITGNKKHYPDEPFILTPTDFLEKIEK